MTTLVIQTIAVSGAVQGVGFRPLVYRLAKALCLTGYVANQRGHVEIVVEGKASELEQFHQHLQSDKTTKAQIESFRLREEKTTQRRFSAFDIRFGAERSELEPDNEIGLNHAGLFDIPVDLAICPDCTAELLSPNGRRHNYPFISCTQCGPRYTIARTMPFEREATTMSEFPMCTSCSQEYSDPENRRFHAQTICCPECGPQLALRVNGRLIDGHVNNADLIDQLYTKVNAGKVAAVKGMGGFHLICDANNEDAVRRLRVIKRRPHKPFAVMGESISAFQDYVEMSESVVEAFESDQAPIVLALKKHNLRTDSLKSVAPDSPSLGIMRPYSPLYRMLFDSARRIHTPDLYLVVTSANLSGEPLITDNSECIEKFSALVDVFLFHDLTITHRIDDSVVQAGCQTAEGSDSKTAEGSYDKTAEGSNSADTTAIRLGRGLSPLIIGKSEQNTELDKHAVLGCGAYLKTTVCVGDRTGYRISPYIGDLDSKAQLLAYKHFVDEAMKSMPSKPRALAADLHEDFYSTRLARELSDQFKIPLIQVQHHHAHIAAVLAEHELPPNCIGLAMDGFGLGDSFCLAQGFGVGSDNALWGGELFHVSDLDFTRIGHFSEIKLPGGDKASKEPWRLAYGLALDLNLGGQTISIPDELDREQFETLLCSDLCARSSSAGRWFDAFAALLGFKGPQTYEGQAATYSEGLCLEFIHHETIHYEPIQYEPNYLEVICSADSAAQSTQDLVCEGLVDVSDGMLDLTPLFVALSGVSNKRYVAARFHLELIDGLARWIQNAVEKFPEKTIVCSGGCFQNRILREGLRQRILNDGLQVYFPEKVPSNDSGISLGQALIAQKKLQVARR